MSSRSTLAALALQRAKEKRDAEGPVKGKLEIEQRDFVHGPQLPAASFRLVFDRGCFHVFDDKQGADNEPRVSPAKRPCA